MVLKSPFSEIITSVSSKKREDNIDVDLLSEIEVFIKKEEESDTDTSYRDKDKENRELAEYFRGVLSDDTIETIKNNPKKMKEIIDALRKKGIKKENGIDLSKLKTISKARERGL